MPTDNSPAGPASRLGATLLCWLALIGTPLAAQEPLSAIDWLSKSVTTPIAVLPPEEPAVSKGAMPEDVAVSTLDGPSPDAAGLLPGSITGLPRNLWGMGRTDEIVTRIAGAPTETLPALRALLMTLLLAEADAPVDAAGKGRLLLARIDKLLAMGALDQAKSLMEAGGQTGPQYFRRTFDVALLTGEEDAACATMQESPDLAPTFPARIFCLARSGDWNAAALTLRTAQALGFITDQEDALLSRFLDPDLYEGEEALPAPEHPTPLVWRMMEAIGEPLPTQTLPLAFSHAELRDAAGWKAQIEAAERLTRAGALEPNQLLGRYTERLPAASGGVWDRVQAFQRFDEAMSSGDAESVAQALPVVWLRMTEAELEVPFANLYSEALRKIPLTGEAAALAFRVGLLSDRYEGVAQARRPVTATEGFLVALAKGSVEGATPTDSMGRAIASAFLGGETSEEATALLAENRVGEAVLLAMEQIQRGVHGDLRGVSEGLTLLRKLGLETAARRTGLELLLLERRG